MAAAGGWVRSWWFAFLTCGVGALAAAVAWLPKGWSTGSTFAASAVCAVAAGAAGSLFTEALTARRDRRRVREALDRAQPLAGESGGPAELLVPGRRVVDFVGRLEELADLIGWCEVGSADRVRLVTGPGGVGKTRLAVELYAHMSELGWRCVQVADGAEATVVDTVREVSGGRVLLVVDYAEVRIGLSALLRQVAADQGAALRVLLLARSAGEWWDRLKASEPAIRNLLAQAYVGDDLATVVEAGTSDTELVNGAVPVFAAALGVDPAPRVELPQGQAGSRILDLHATALVAVLRAADRQADGEPTGVVRVEVGGVLDEVLEHEGRFWLGTAARAGLCEGPAGMRPETLRQIVAAGCLLGAATQDEAVGLLGRVPGAVASVRVAGWLRDLYPSAPGGEWLGLLQPDRLAEHHTIHQLTVSPQLTAACLTGLNDRQALRAMTLLGRASTDQPTALPLLQRVLPLLDRLISDLPPDLNLLTTLSNTIPFPSLALAEAHLAITRRILTLLGPGRSPDHASWLTWLGVTLAQTANHTQALPITQETVETYRELAAADPDRHRPDLATSLSNLGIAFAELGRPAEALTAEQEAVEIRRELAATDPDRHRPDLATSLSNIGVTFSELGRPAEALPGEQEAVEIRRELAATDPDRYRPDLAASLSNLGIWFAALGRLAEALTVTQEAVEIRRELAATDPDRHRPDLADSLTNLGNRFAALGRPAEALTVTQEAVEILRELAAAYHDRYRPALAGSLFNLGIRFSELGRPAEALTAEQEAVEIRRELAAAYPDRYRPDLATSLFNLGIRFSELGRPAEAQSAHDEAAQLRSEG